MSWITGSGDSTLATSSISVVAEDSDSDNGDVLNTTLGESYGMLVIRESVNHICSVYRLEYESAAIMSGNENFTTIKDTASSINVYYESGAFRVQNLYADNLDIAAGFFGVTA